MIKTYRNVFFFYSAVYFPFDVIFIYQSFVGYERGDTDLYSLIDVYCYKAKSQALHLRMKVSTLMNTRGQTAYVTRETERNWTQRRKLITNVCTMKYIYPH